MTLVQVKGTSQESDHSSKATISSQEIEQVHLAAESPSSKRNVAGVDQLSLRSSNTNPGKWAYDVDYDSAGYRDAPKPLPGCMYHAPLLNHFPTGSHIKALVPVTRWQSEGPSDQPALFSRPDNGELSTSKGCSCCTSWELVAELTDVAMAGLNEEQYDDVGISGTTGLRL
ncbi:hypothetical protein BU16DRAFT_567176 [Lophium mytilinum]|uniref:Uncharacterized protein n=1 Tax=Lophium mytilinum TaxID=390894 RepID=A0A6A6QDK6_9PEZI|nr:hypothetical protein BU16DRAFT_567176 [Lophium mytilinum]